MGLMDAMEEIALEPYDRIIGLEVSDVAVDECATKAPCGGSKSGKSPVDRGKRGIKRSTMVDAKGTSPLASSPHPPTTTTHRFWLPPWTPPHVKPWPC